MINNYTAFKIKVILSFLIILYGKILYAQPFVEQTGISLTGVFDGSVAWGDYDNDGDLDILLTGSTGSSRISKIYRNNGNNTFTEQTGISLVGVSGGSVAWGDYDNDGDLDILLTGYSSSGRVSKIYRNNGDNTFTEQTGIPLTGVYYSSVAWGDYDNDGDLDILLTGNNTDSGRVSKIYRNNGDNTFTEQTGISLTGVEDSSVAWGDYDNDGDLDILLTGSTSSSGISKIYRNNGDNTYTEQTGISLAYVSDGSVVWGDYDNDGDLDILLTGSGTYSKIYCNNGNNTFTEQTGISLAGVFFGSVAWGDYDNDGDLDILLTGNNTGLGRVSKIYRNNGDNTFTEQTGISLAGVYYSSVAWGDYDNDGDLDILLTGYTGSVHVSKIYRNDGTSFNSAPVAPTGLTSGATSTGVVLKWAPVKTDVTPYKAMSYNVRVGKAPDTCDVVSPHAAKTGYRRVAAMGDGQLDTTFVLRNLKKGTYYWSVQAIDQCFAGSSFATGQTFTFNADIPASEMVFSSITGTSVKCLWTRGNGDKCILFVKENGSGTASPENNTTYIGERVLGNGTQIGSSGWYCVYNGLADTITVTGLNPLTSYAFHVLEYNGTTSAEQYFTYDEPSAHAIQISALFTGQTGISLPEVSDGSVAWGDYDNDGDLDILLTGYSPSGRVSKIYRNNGNNTFTAQTGISLPGVYGSSVSWGDYDNDGDLDILLTGITSSGSVSKIYRNNGDNTFTAQTGISLTGVGYSSVAWGDYDNDGDLDILLTGNSSSGGVSKIYRNNGNNTFTEQTGISLTGVGYSSIAWGDYDNDGNLDILLTGNSSSGGVSKIYRNNGDNTFTEQTGISLTGVGYSSVAWGDYDNDGDLDILLTGNNTGLGCVSKIYRNNGDNTFTEQTAISLTGVSGSVAWGDYDNDGDLDILLTGYIISSYISKIYRNNGDNTFTEQTGISLAKVYDSSVAWGDYDNDGDLDILLTGNNTGSDRVSKIYRNDGTSLNSVPVAPTGLTSGATSTGVVLKWGPVKTDVTPYKTMSYNVRVGKTTDTCDAVSPHAAKTGYRRVAAMGNGQLDTTFILRNLIKGTYYWSVQATDQCFAGGAFAAEKIFTFNTDVQGYTLVFNVITPFSVKCSWVRGNGDKCVVFVKENGSGSYAPVNNTTYSANKVFGSGSQIGTTGWYCVYNGNLDTATITNLKPNTGYRFQVIEYTGNTGAEVYYTTTGMGNPAQYIPPFMEQSQVSLTGISGRTQVWGDYDNDGYLDILVAGNDGSTSVVKLYRNNGDNTFTLSPATFDVNTVYDAAWGDYDNDGDLDLLVAGSFNSKVFENKGDGTFALKIMLPDVFMGKCLWADLDNDGFKDIILTGMGGTRVYKNNHNGTFAEQTTTLPAVSNNSAVACGDYDNDGDLDILLAGLNNSTEITKVFKNDGGFIFTEQTGIVLPGVSNCSVAWADMDNGGDLDIVLSGGGYNLFTKIYDNNGNNTFSEIAGTPFPGLYRTALDIADYDNDGYRDLTVSGTIDDSDYYTLVYRNNGNKTYSQDTLLSFPGVQTGTVAWGDYDNDGDLDLFLSGNSASGKIAKIFKNNTTVTNTRPGIPSGLYYQKNGFDITFKWGKPANDETTPAGFSYNLYVYETSKTGYAKSPDAFPENHAMNGQRLVAQAGNIQYSSSGYTLKGLPAGNYRWSLQAVDAGLMGSNFAVEDSLNIPDLSGVDINVAEGMLINTTSKMSYSINSTNGIDGHWGSCNQNYTIINYDKGGFNIWVHEVTNPNNKRKVATILPQASAPNYTIDFANEYTMENIPDTVHYYSYYHYTSADGLNEKIQITPGYITKFWVPATKTKVRSADQVLSAPSRPVTPAFAIDYINETTAENVLAETEYATNNQMSNAESGTGNKIKVLPGHSLYFRTKATLNAFNSEIQYLWMPVRPCFLYIPVVNDAANTFDWSYNSNYPNVEDYEYSTDNGNTWAICSSKPIDIGNVSIPSGFVKVRTKAKVNSFSGEVLSSNAAFTLNTGISDIKEAGINIYPNPVGDYLNVENLRDDAEISLSTITGTIVNITHLKAGDKTINLGHLSSGLYLIRIKTKTINAVTQIIKQ